jgi:hypothetical protein
VLELLIDAIDDGIEFCDENPEDSDDVQEHVVLCQAVQEVIHEALSSEDDQFKSFRGEYQLAANNGCTLSIGDYVAQMYVGYTMICTRLGIKPAMYHDWIATK